MSVLKQFEHLKIQLEAIESATNNFAQDNCIGKGGFGKVYKGELLHSKGHTTVAIKRLDRAFGQGDSEFWKEVIMLSVYKHENIVSLLGFCDEKGENILVYAYSSRRSLDSHLDNMDLTWVQRLNICIGAARGLAYLHNPEGTQQRVLHRDIKSSNILLDDNWNARIADLGLSKFGPANQRYTFLVTNNRVGTIGYCDPIYLESGILTKESDVYSFGVVLFEVLCGRLCFGKNDKAQSFTQMVRKHYKQKNLNEVIWGNIKDEIRPSSLEVFSTIAYQCLKNDNEKRPLMNHVVTELETALEYQLSAVSVSTHTQEDNSQPGFQKLKAEKNDLLEQYDTLLETHGVDEENMASKLPKNLRRHICFDLVKKVPLFSDMNERLLDDMCERLKQHIFIRKTCIIREGDPVYAMLFIVRGRLKSATTDGGSNGFLEEGDFFGEELLTWALDDKSSGADNLPSSTRTLKALRDVEAFALPADELKFVLNQVERKHASRFYSHPWRNWAACFIQAAWWRYSTRKILEQRWKAEEEAHNNGSGGGSSYRLGATFLSWTFSTRALRGVLRNRNRNQMNKLKKPVEPNFTAHAD